MSAFYDQASLVVVPSGYKSGKIYAQKPLTTDGQLTFSRASTATRVNASGLIETVASNVPRLDYLGSTCPKLLLEPQRTNLFTYSEQINNAAWTKTECTITANTAISPDGYTNADKVVPSVNNANHFFTQDLSITSGTTYTQTIYAKADGYSFVQMTGSISFNTTFANFNLSNGTLGSTDGGAATITNVGNGWYRLTYTLTATTTTAGRIVLAIVPLATSGRLDTFAGDGTSGVLFYGCQLEEGAYATSYIPTTSAAVTRLADDAYKGGISSLIGQSEGTIFIDYILTDNDNNRYVQLYNNEKDASAISVISIESNGSAIAASCFRGNGTFDKIALTASGYLIGQRIKVAFRYKSGDFALYVNGIQKDIDTGSLTFIGTKSEINLADPDVYFAYKGGVLYNQFLQFKMGLTNAQLAEITKL